MTSPIRTEGLVLGLLAAPLLVACQSPTNPILSGGTGGATVASGTGGATVTSGTGGAIANPCGEHPALDNLMHTTTRGEASASQSYDGPAVVERSTQDDMVLAFTPGTGGDPGGSTSGPSAHATLARQGAMPALPVGGKVWLSKTPAGNRDSSRALMYGPEAWSFWVRDRQGGRLLIGSAFLSLGPSPPIEASAPVGYCTALSPAPCDPQRQVTYGAVEIRGDAPVSIRDGETGTVMLAGIAYDATVRAQQLTGPIDGLPLCPDYHRVSGVALDIVARDWAAATANVEVGDAPACAEGNDPVRSVYMSLTGVSLSTTFEGRVVYTGVDQWGSQEFRVVGLTGDDGQPAGFDIAGAADLFATASPGDEFWLSFPSLDVQALRRSQGGDLVVVMFFGRSPPSAEDAATLAQILGVSVTVEPRCTYAGSSDTLDDVVFGTTPAVRVKSGSLGVLTLGGKAYNVSARAGRGSAQLMIY